jgi:hypothetical protein
MNVLFAYNHADHAEPLLRAAEHFAGLGIKFISDTRLTEYDDKWTMRQADVILLQEPPIRKDILNCGKPIILLERIDGAQLRGCREHLHQVAGVIKGYLFRDRAQNNTVFDRSHIEILHDASVTGNEPRHCDEPPSPLVEPSDLQKVFAGYGFGSRAAMEPLVNSVIDFDAPRPIDVTFHGIVEYAQTEVETHRRLAIDVARQWSEDHCGGATWGIGRVLKEDDFYLSLLRSKTALSPFGWGEACCRDYQAMALGSVVIKPDMSHVECWPDIFQAGETYLPCKPDWSDAHKIIREVVDNWSDYRPLREQARRMAVLAFQPNLIAKQMAWAIGEIMRHHKHVNG